MSSRARETLANDVVAEFDSPRAPDLPPDLTPGNTLSDQCAFFVTANQQPAFFRREPTFGKRVRTDGQRLMDPPKGLDASTNRLRRFQRLLGASDCVPGAGKQTALVDRCACEDVGKSIRAWRSFLRFDQFLRSSGSQRREFGG